MHWHNSTHTNVFGTFRWIIIIEYNVQIQNNCIQNAPNWNKTWNIMVNLWSIKCEISAYVAFLAVFKNCSSHKIKNSQAREILWRIRTNSRGPLLQEKPPINSKLQYWMTYLFTISLWYSTHNQWSYSDNWCLMHNNAITWALEWNVHILSNSEYDRRMSCCLIQIFWKYLFPLVFLLW